MAAEYFSCHSLSKVLAKQHSHDLELSCIFGNVRGNVWMGPLGMLRRSCVFLSAFQRANILLHLRTYSCEILGSWNSLLITPVPLLGEVFFPRPVHVVIWELFSCLGIWWPDTQRMWRMRSCFCRNASWWYDFTMGVKDLFLTGRTGFIPHWSYTSKGMFMENPSLIWDSGSYSVRI